MRSLHITIPAILSFAFFSLVLPVYGKEPAPEELTAEQLLERMARAYAECNSYHDSGIAKNIFIMSIWKRYTVKKPFKTAFIRLDRFRFEYHEKGRKKSQYIIWRKGDEAFTWWGLRPGIEKEESLGMAVAGAGGVSSGSAHTIPALLLPDEIGGRRLTDLTDARRIEDAKSGKAECFRIEGDFSGSPMTIWIDKATYLVRRIDSSYQFEDFRTSSTTTYEPEINVDIPDELLEFNLPE